MTDNTLNSITINTDFLKFMTEEGLIAFRTHLENLIAPIMAELEPLDEALEAVTGEIERRAVQKGAAAVKEAENIISGMELVKDFSRAGFPDNGDPFAGTIPAAKTGIIAIGEIIPAEPEPEPRPAPVKRPHKRRGALTWGFNGGTEFYPIGKNGGRAKLGNGAYLSVQASKYGDKNCSKCKIPIVKGAYYALVQYLVHNNQKNTVETLFDQYHLGCYADPNTGRGLEVRG